MLDLRQLKRRHRQTDRQQSRVFLEDVYLSVVNGPACTDVSCGEYLQSDVGLRPVLQVTEEEVGVSVHEVDADQLLAARAAEAGETLADGPTRALHTHSVVLAVGQVAERAGRCGYLTQLTTAERENTHTHTNTYSLVTGNVTVDQENIQEKNME